MDIEYLLWIDIIAIIAIPISILVFASSIAIGIGTLLTAGLIYLDVLTYRLLKNDPSNTHHATQEV